MKFYVAARFDLREEVKRIHKLLKEHGHEITYDWTNEEKIKPYDKNQELASRYSIKSVRGVRDSDVFILISDAAGTDMYGEIVAAIISNSIDKKPQIYVIGNYLDKSKFFFHPSVNRRRTIEEVLDEVNSHQ